MQDFYVHENNAGGYYITMGGGVKAIRIKAENEQQAIEMFEDKILGERGAWDIYNKTACPCCGGYRFTIWEAEDSWYTDDATDIDDYKPRTSPHCGL